jgi:hypothetical protein
MDYKGILARAWEVTWKYKILWLFGLFAGSSFGGSSRAPEYKTGTTTGTMTQAQAEAALANARTTAKLWAAQAHAIYDQYAALIWIGVCLAVLFIIVAVIVNATARGGLVYLVNEADEGRAARAGDGWRVGFAKWWRVFCIGFLASLPMAVVGLIVSGLVAAAIVAWLNNPFPTSLGPDLIGTFIIAACGLLVISIVAVFLGVTLGIASELGLRYAVLHDRGAIDSLKQGWRDLWAKRGAFKMFMVQLGVGILFAIAIGIVGAILMGPSVIVSTASGIRVDQPASAGLGFLLLIPSAMFAAFYSAAWTVFFRRMSGMRTQVVAAPAQAPVPIDG